MDRSRCVCALLVSAALSSLPSTARAQAAATGGAEELEPRVVAASGVTTIGLSGFADKVSSSEDVFPWRVTAQVEVTHFVVKRLAARVGLIGSTTADGLDDDERITAAAPAFYLSAATLFYLTPGRLLSPYGGVEYRARLTDRPEKDAGTALGLAGVQAALSSRAAVFVEAGLGMDLTRGADRELRTRFVSAVGVRIRF